MRKQFSKLTAGILAASLAVGGVAPVSALAANAPTETVEVDSSIVTASAHRAASPLPEILGANTPSGYGMINGGAPTEDDAEGNFALEVWGTSENNVNPDPYWVNYYYELTDGVDVEISNALINLALSGSPIMADKNLYSEYGGVSVSVYTRPDILIGVSSSSDPTDYTGYDDQLATIAATGEIYTPELVAYNPTTLDDMIDTVYEAADAIISTGKSYRYDNPTAIADDYAEYIQGIKGYIKQAIGESNYKTIAIVSAVSTDDDGVNTYTIQGQGSSSATSTNRYVEYTEDVTNNLTSASSATVYSSDLAGVDAIVITSDTVEDAIKNDTTITSATNMPELISVNKMETLYGISMNSVENALGMGYILARIYDDSASVLDAEYIYEYFASKFYHIKSSELENIYAMAITDNITDEYESGDLHISEESYNETTLESLFATYAAYY